jgi:hypothetical protein
VAAALPSAARNRAAGLGGLTTLLALVLVAVRFPAVRAGGVLVERVAWIPALGLDLVFRLVRLAPRAPYARPALALDLDEAAPRGCDLCAPIGSPGPPSDGHPRLRPSRRDHLSEHFQGCCRRAPSSVWARGRREPHAARERRVCRRQARRDDRPVATGDVRRVGGTASTRCVTTRPCCAMCTESRISPSGSSGETSAATRTAAPNTNEGARAYRTPRPLRHVPRGAGVRFPERPDQRVHHSTPANARRWTAPGWRSDHSPGTYLRGRCPALRPARHVRRARRVSHWLRGVPFAS